MDKVFNNYALLSEGSVGWERWAQTKQVGLNISGTEDKTKTESLRRDWILRIRQNPGEHTRYKVRVTWQQGAWMGTPSKLD